MADSSIEIGIELNDSGVPGEAKKAGDKAGEAFAKGINHGADEASDALSDVGDTAQDTAKDVSKAGESAGNNFGNSIEDGAENASKSVSDVADTAQDTASAVSNAGEDGATNFANAMEDGAENAAAGLGQVSDAAEDVAQNTSHIGDEGGKSLNDMAGSTDVAGNGLVNLAKKAVAAIGVMETLKKTAEFLKSSLDSYADYEQLVGGAETLFKDSSGKLLQYAQDAYKTSGISANSYLEQVTSFSASLISSYGGDVNQAADAADKVMQAIADNSAKMGTNIESIQMAYQSLARGNYGMLDNLKLGYGGTKTELERLLKDAEAYEAANGRMTKYSIDNFGDVAAAIQVIQDEMGITGTTQKEATETITGSLQMVTAAYQNVLTGIADEDQNLGDLTSKLFESLGYAAANIGKRFIEIFNQLGSFISSELPNFVKDFMEGGREMLVGFVSSLVKNIPLVIAGLAQVAAVLVEQIAIMIPQILAEIYEAWPSVLASLIQAAVSIVLSLVDALPQIIESLVDAIPRIIVSMVDALIAAYPALISGFIQIFIAVARAMPQIIAALVQAIPTIVQAITSGLTERKDQVLQASIELFMELMTAIAEATPEIMQALGNLLMSLIIQVGAWVSEMAAKARQAGSQFLQGVANFISQLPGKVAQFLSNIITNVANFVASMGAKALEAGRNFFNNIVNTLSQIPGRVVSIGSDIIKGLWNGISNMGSWIAGKIKGFGDGVLQGLKDFFGIHSPSKLMEDEVGKYIGMGIVVGFEDVDPLGQIERSLTANMAGLQMAAMSASSGNITNNTQTVNFNQPVRTPDEVARAMRMQSRYGLAGSY